MGDSMKKWQDIDGWLEPDVGKKLQELAFCNSVLEIGCYKGKSTVCMASKAHYILSIDPFKADNSGQTQLEHLTTLDEFRKNVSEFGNVSYIMGKSPEDIPLDRTFDFIFVDGFHECSHVKKEIEALKIFLRMGGIIAFHDYNPACGVYQAVNDSDDLIILGQVDSLVWCEYA
jgi:predicted O-methyltransferase YrrM